MMDASASAATIDAEFNKVYGFYLKVEDTTFPTAYKQKNTVIKFTKIPNSDVDIKSEWGSNYELHPRLRRIISLDEGEIPSPRSLKTIVAPSIIVPTAPSHTRRKIATISEDDENDLHPNFSKNIHKSLSAKSNRPVQSKVNVKEIYPHTTRTTLGVANTSQYSREPRQDVKLNNLNKKNTNVTKLNNRSKLTSSSTINSDRNTGPKEKVSARSVFKSPTLTKDKRNIAKPTESEQKIMLIRNKLQEDSPNPVKKPIPKYQPPPPRYTKKSPSSINEVKPKNKPTDVIRVPLDDKYRVKAIDKLYAHPKKICRSDNSTETDNKHCKDVEITTEPKPETMDRDTEMDDDFRDLVCDYGLSNIDLQKDLMFDSLHVPNVTLTKEKNDSKDVVKLCSQSMPSLSVPALMIAPCKRTEECEENVSYCKSSSYFIGQGTITYTTKQKINFHVVGSEGAIPNLTSSPSYPLNVVSVLKNEIRNQNTRKVRYTRTGRKCSNVDNVQSVNCSYVTNSDKLVKPSDIISAMSINNGLLPKDYITEQFQRELNFIDSFYESLKYLESCSLLGKSFDLSKTERCISRSGLDVDGAEYSQLLRKLENGAFDDTHTMASKSLCLLNLLIRDEQRRAKNLLFVLKMREDALKDFTKSQILWLENKKKTENIDISTLKKKQRGALLKLQHECGEMQRMRKALLTLSDKRKAVLMKTKKNIELKITSNVDVDKILSNAKKIRRNSMTEKSVTPLKCFDLTSSCDDAIVKKSESFSSAQATSNVVAIADKNIQTGEKHTETMEFSERLEAAEHYVVVDGTYLNILFQNLNLPQIFSGGKQYEVNEEAIKNILNSAINQSNVFESDVVTKFLQQFKEEKSSSPSTARSLVEELDQYYNVHGEHHSSPDRDDEDYSQVFELSDCEVHNVRRNTKQSTGAMTYEEPINQIEIESRDLIPLTAEMENESVSQIGPLPVPAGAPSDGLDEVLWTPKSATSILSDTPTFSALSSNENLKISSESLNPTDNQRALSPVPTLPDSISPGSMNMSPRSLASATSDDVTSPPAVAVTTPHSSLVDSEAERLRRQQLAIEREIKALEQQQCLLVVREIPDKPPPPYTPPTDVRPSKPPRKFCPNLTTEDCIKEILEGKHKEASDAFDTFVSDFCDEMLERLKSEKSDKPWDALNLLPKQPEPDTSELAKKTYTELNDVLTTVPTVSPTGLGTRRSDHIDDILLSEWRRRETEWTSLHVEEATVKNQLFETIFQRLLKETVDEYKNVISN